MLFPLRVERELDLLFFLDDDDFAKGISQRGDYSIQPAPHLGACYNRAMAGSHTVDLLRRVPFLHGIDEPTLLELVPTLPQQKYAPGETIYEQGERADCLYLLLSGRAALTHHGPEDEQIDQGERLPPDMLGAQELVYRQPYAVTARAVQETTVICWARKPLTAFLKDHPQALAGFQFLAAGEKMASSQQLSWLRHGEVL